MENTQKYVYWYICHVLLSEIVRQLEPHVSHLMKSINLSSIKFHYSSQRVCFVHATIGILFICTNFKPLVVCSIFAMVISYYIAMLLTKRCVWSLTVVWLAILNMLKQSVWEEYLSTELTEKEIYDAMICLSWLLLRVTSFAIDYCNFKAQNIEKTLKLEHEVYSTLNYLSYSFYLPVCLHGPPLIYERYAKMYARNQLYRVEESWNRFKTLVICLIRIGCIYLMNELCMHFIYANVIIYNPDVRAVIYWNFFNLIFSKSFFSL